VEVASYRQNQSAISRPMSKGRGKQWQPTPKNLPVPEPYRSPDWALVPAKPAQRLKTNE
jgi:hypothetical protein